MTEKGYLSSMPAGPDRSPVDQMISACFVPDAAKVRALIDRFGKGLLLGAQTGPDKAIHVAASVGSVEIVQMLLAAGEQVDVLGADGSPLHYAAEAGSVQVAALLLDAGADVNSLHKRVTPIMAATDRSWCRPEIVMYLLSRGADVGERIRDVNGYDFLRTVLRRDNADVFVALAKSGVLQKASSEPALEYALGKAQMADVSIPKIVDACLADAQLCEGFTADYLRELVVYERDSQVRSTLLSKATELALLEAAEPEGSSEESTVRRHAGDLSL